MTKLTHVTVTFSKELQTVHLPASGFNTREIHKRSRWLLVTAPVSPERVRP